MDTNQQQYDNTNSGAAFPYSDKEMRGPWQFDQPDRDLTLHMGQPDDNGRFPVTVTKDEQVLAKGSVRRTTLRQPADPAHEPPAIRGSLMIQDTGEIISLVGWKKRESGTDREYLQIREDNRGNTGRCFV